MFKYNSCGGWDELEVFMDCEDLNSQSSKSGTTGASYVDGNKNVHLKFCVVLYMENIFTGLMLIMQF